MKTKTKRSETQRERRLEYGRRYRAKNRERIRAKDRERIESLSDSYVREILRKGTSLSAKDFPPEVVELQRNRIRLLRAIRKTNKTEQANA